MNFCYSALLKLANIFLQKHYPHDLLSNKGYAFIGIKDVASFGFIFPFYTKIVEFEGAIFGIAFVIRTLNRLKAAHREIIQQQHSEVLLGLPCLFIYFVLFCFFFCVCVYITCLLQTTFGSKSIETLGGGGGGGKKKVDLYTYEKKVLRNKDILFKKKKKKE
ncbi:hypothetical protein RFI_27751 [Reticulomyxa filosa]|uniref:Uncharacterized protein n=1 Tax=Reticulomyxa filosa TaxID=46433 RepID=X6M6T6_RETFI|nr:hypothetical protein RFI_27751 [Reticulomyxa filosa]|eukprot:ETO09629.1 hypothetical protein RFI_27751 [Reticulomyxa filosa]